MLAVDVEIRVIPGSIVVCFSPDTFIQLHGVKNVQRAGFDQYLGFAEKHKKVRRGSRGCEPPGEYHY